MNFNDFTGYVLAGGKSYRMGTDKAFLRLGDETFVNRAVESLSPVCENRIVIVLNQTLTHFIEQLPADIPYIFDVYENRGALGGIHSALKNCETQYAVILAVDLPFVTTEAIRNLADKTLSLSNPVAVVPRQTDGRLQPLCAAYHARRCLPALENLLNETDSASVRDFLKLIAPQIIDQNKLTADQSREIFFNVNHQVDFQKLK